MRTVIDQFSGPCSRVRPAKFKSFFQPALCTQRYNKYHSNLFFWSVSYKLQILIFSTWIYGLGALGLGHKSERKKTQSVSYIRDLELNQ